MPKELKLPCIYGIITVKYSITFYSSFYIVFHVSSVILRTVSRCAGEKDGEDRYMWSTYYRKYALRATFHRRNTAYGHIHAVHICICSIVCNMCYMNCIKRIKSRF